MDNRALLETNLEVVRQVLEHALGRGEVSILRTLVAPDYVGHLAIGDHYGPEGMRINISAYRSMIPDLSITVDDLFAVGDRVARRFTLRGTVREAEHDGEAVELHGVAIDRLRDGQLVETWARIDTLPTGS